ALVPVVSLALGPRMAVGVASMVGLPSVAQLLPEAVRMAERGFVLPAAGAIVIGAPVGSLILTSIDPHMMTGAIGFAVMAMALATWCGVSPGMARRNWVPMAAGFISGLLQGAAGIGGPPSVAVAVARGGKPREQRGNVLGVVTVIALSGAISQISFGIYTAQAFGLAVVLLPLFIGSTWAGSRFFSTGGQRHFRTVALFLLLGIGMAAVIGALRNAL
ncbi:MAG: TSUP family transporter, partial [Hyphomicrobiaceae bacterium]